MSDEPRGPRPREAVDAGGGRGKDESVEQLNAQVRQLALGQDRLRRLLDAVVAITADMETSAVLQHIVAAASDLLAVRYGALAVLGEGGEFVDLFTVGVDAERLRAESGLPQRHGLLGSLLTGRRPLRIDDVLADPRSVGFPAGHPVMTTLLGAPLTVRDTVYGTLYVADKEDGTPFSADDEALLAALASAAGVSIENSRLYARLKRAAEQFQRRMLPVLPDLAPLRVQARYQPASELPRLGGDWYDAVELPDGAVFVVVGDVTGHDVEAAPLMGQIRNMLRALAFDRCGPPGQVVHRLDRALAMYGETTAATLVMGRIERGPDGGYALHWTNAGHPPPLLVTADGTAHSLAPAQHGIPVGVDPSLPRPDHTHPLPPASTLVLFTDGLIERRGQDIDTGLRELAVRAAGLATAPLERMCDALINRQDVYDDDVALLALRIPDAP
ncbi:PP2C family protein-serine/threonine phosphatase [Streptomyces mexicanus]|uniref:PP2C family protein-serine/threonine phosphatase n=1 Tax=Streptomyces mexicanus TaxID=178566 RepID=UPI0036C32E86